MESIFDILFTYFSIAFGVVLGAFLGALAVIGIFYIICLIIAGLTWCTEQVKASALARK